ncbi:MAG: hypothetical protein GZ089_08455 [Aromatoleum sp.]|nr:hypothetical protein [Aromatoleum sp.]
MKRMITLVLVTTLLGGCAIVPFGYGYRGDRYRDGYQRNDRYQERYRQDDRYYRGYGEGR